jgi:hypothetical protein
MAITVSQRARIRRFVIKSIWTFASFLFGIWFAALASQLAWFKDARGQASAVSAFLAWLMAQNWFVAVSCVILGLLFATWADRRFLLPRWWEGLRSFSIRDAACLMAGVYPAKFESSPRAIGIANELKGLIDSGHMPIVLESRAKRASVEAGVPAVIAAYERVYDPPYDVKNVSYDAVILKSDIEKFARGRGHSLPWPNIPPEDKPVPLLDGGTTTLGAIVKLGLGAQESAKE